MPHTKQIIAIAINKLAAMIITNLGLNTALYIKTSFTSIIGPNIRKASLAALEKLNIWAAINASEVLHRDSTKANIIIEGIPTQSD